MEKVKGIDVSSYQGTIDWAKAAASGVEFAILKIIRKDLRPDKQFENNWNGCTSAGVPIQGVYNYSYANTVDKAKTDAQKVVETLAGRKSMVWLDVEDGCLEGLGSKLIDIINAYAEVIYGAGLEFGVYTGLSFYNTYIKPYADQVKYPFWIARYPSTTVMTIGDEPADDKRPDIAHELYGWQYSSHGQIAGITGAVDLDELYVAIEAVNIMPAPEKTVHKVGEQINLTKYYVSSSATSGAVSKSKTGTIIKIKEGTSNPYCFGINGVATGWCNDDGIVATQPTAETSAAASTTHTVKRGDTLSALAKKYGTTVNAIVEANRSKYPKITANYIVVGWDLII